MTRPTSSTCEVCGRQMEIPAKGRIAAAHRECGTVRNDFDRLERAVDVATEGMSPEELRAFRKYLVGQFMHWTNGKFNATKANGAKGRKAKAAKQDALEL